MLKNRKVILLLILAITFLISPNFSKDNKVTKIDNVLKNKYYSYLPAESKEFVKDVYEVTGEVVLTEKNKKDGKPYLNPKFVTYLSMSDKEKEEVDVIPNTYVIDFEPSNVVESTGLPTYYNISNINNSSYITPINDQGQSGLCWAFTSAELAESNLMVKNNAPYNSNSSRFSVRQIDYATSTNGINNYANENGVRLLYYDGGNFMVSSQTMSLGKSLINYNVWPFDESKIKKELKDVLNFDKSKYELNGSIMLPELLEEYTQDEKDEYNNLIKSYVMSNGGAYAGTESPQGYCGFVNTDGKYVVVDNSECTGYSGHAMQVIGWDDNYTYKYCKVPKQIPDTNTTVISHGSASGCSASNLVSGKGAWILRNSWGDNSYKYIYLAYNSYNVDYNFITDLSSTSSKIWDNVYHKKIWEDGLDGYMYYTPEDINYFEKPINTSEKLQYIKFMSAETNSSFNITVVTNSNTYENIKTINTEQIGIYKVDLSDKNIILDGEEFAVIVSSPNYDYLYQGSVSVFTSNIDKTPVINTVNLTDSNATKDSNNNYRFIIYSSTKNINGNQSVSYELYQNEVNKSNYIKSYSNAIVAENNINGTLVLDKNIPSGKYVLRIKYGNYSFDSFMFIGLNRKITYHKNDNTNISYNQDFIANEEFTLAPNTFTRVGYNFINWNTKADGSGTSYNNEQLMTNGFNDNLDLYAIWSPIKYKVAFNSNGGVGTMQPQELTYGIPTNLSSNTFTRTDFIFKEWNTKADGSGFKYYNEASVINLTSIENATFTLYAIWVPSKYTITFDSNGGTNISSIVVDYNTKVSKPVDPTKDGYTFGGWYTNSSLTNVFDFNTLIKQNYTLYAKWIKNPTSIPVYRMYNPVNGEHLYTADAHEVDVIYKTLGWGFEGVGWYSSDAGNTPVYRLYSPRFNNHLYTSDRNEMNIITSQYGWVFDNIINGVPQPVMYSDGDTEIYRLYNPRQNDQHHLTTDKNEYNIIPQWGWRQEGVAMKATSLGIPITTYYYKNSHRDIDFNNIKNNK